MTLLRAWPRGARRHWHSCARRLADGTGCRRVPQHARTGVFPRLLRSGPPQGSCNGGDTLPLAAPQAGKRPAQVSLPRSTMRCRTVLSSPRIRSRDLTGRRRPRRWSSRRPLPLGRAGVTQYRTSTQPVRPIRRATLTTGSSAAALVVSRYPRTQRGMHPRGRPAARGPLVRPPRTARRTSRPAGRWQPRRSRVAPGPR